MVVPESRKKNVYMAKLCKEAERYEEMFELMEKVAKTVDADELTIEERDLLNVAYKNVVGGIRGTWKTISSIEKKEEKSRNEDHVNIIKEYKDKLEAELNRICDSILNLLESHLASSDSSAESKVFYLKVKGDYYRYLAEFKTGAESKEAADNSLLAYKSAQDVAFGELIATHPIRLTLALDFAVFYSEILNSRDRAYKMAKLAFDECMAELDNLSGKSYQDSVLVMQLLRDNMVTWDPDYPEEEYEILEAP